MKTPEKISKRQMLLPLEPQTAPHQQPPIALLDELLRAVADLLLEALGKDNEAASRQQRGQHDTQDKA